MRRQKRLAGLVTAAVLVAACGAASTPSPSTSSPAASSGAAASGAAASSAAATYCPSDTTPQTLTWAGTGGDYEKMENAVYLDAYHALCPSVTILHDNTFDNQKLIQMVKSGNVTWDIATPGPDFGLASTAQYLEKIDCTVVPCDKLQPDRYVTTGYRAAQSIGGTLLAWNTDKLGSKPAPQSWADLFDLQKYPGHRVMMGDMFSTPLEVALVADGVAPDKLYPLDIERALKKLDTIKAQTTFTTNYQGCAEMLATGEAVIGQCWSGRVVNQIKTGAHLAYTFNQQTSNAGYLVVPKGSKHVATAMKVIAFVVQPQICAKSVTYIPYGCADPAASALYPPDIAPTIGATKLDANTIYSGDQYYDTHRDELNQRWQAWLTGG